MSSSDWQDGLMTNVPEGSLVLALGPGWVACSDALPWNDRMGWLKYVVYCADYGGDLFVCSFEQGWDQSWWHEKTKLFISGVTHWHVAGECDEDFARLRGPAPTTSQVDPHALAELQRWSDWFTRSRGIGR